MNQEFMHKYLVFGFLLANALSVHAQENNETSFKPQLRGTIMMANSHIPQATYSGKAIVIIPTWGFDFDYYVHRRWSLALQADIKVQTFEIEDENHVAIKRNYPVSISGILHYHTLGPWSFFMGPGVEFEFSRNLFILKTGAEYSLKISEIWEIGIGLIYERREEVYDGITFGVGFNRRLWRKP